MKLTNEQQAIVDAVPDDGQALKAVAYAGTGKTSTLVEIAKKFESDNILYLAFNKSVEGEAAMRFPPNTTVKTGHALAHRFVGYKYKNIRNIYNSTLSKAYDIKLYESSLLLRSLESYLCSAETKPTEDHVAEDELSRLDPDNYKKGMVQRIERCFDDMVNGRNDIPMTHSGYLKLFQLEGSPLGFDTILLDEAQDTNPVQLKIVLDQMQTSKSRVIFVGDPYQQIYSWRGAMNAMSEIKAPELRITQSFRFGPAIAGMATHVLKTFFNEQTSLVGLSPNPDTIGMVSGNHTCLCRTNAGLIREAYRAAGEGATLNVIGDQAFQQTIEQIDNIFLLWLGKRGAVTDRRIIMFKNYQAIVEYAEEALDYELQSKVNIIEEYGSSWPEVRDAIRNALVMPQAANIILTTTHKAKGLEWDSVRLSDDFAELYYEDVDEERRPVKRLKAAVRKPKKDSELNQEEVNLLYVASTRAKRTLQPTMDLRRLLLSQSVS